MTRLLVSQFTSPIILILLAAAFVSFLLADRTDTLILVTIVVLSGLLDFQDGR